MIWYQHIKSCLSDQTLDTTFPPTMSVGTSNTSVPTIAPSIFTVKPTLSPSSIPSQMISSFTIQPSTIAPTRNLISVKSSRLSMTLINMEQNIFTNNDTLREWRNLTSRHVRQYWNMTTSDGQNQSPFFIGRVVTTLISAQRVTIQPELLFIVNSVINNSTGNITTLPDRLEIIYMQDVTYLEYPTGDASFFNFKTSDIFTIPFEEDGLTYTSLLRSTYNNQFIIFLDYTGVVPEIIPPEPVLADPKNRNLIIVLVTVVVTVIAIASLYIYRLKQLQKREIDTIIQQGSARSDLLINNNGHNELPFIIPPAMMGVTNHSTISHCNTNHENVIVSESYDEDYPDTSVLQQKDDTQDNMTNIAMDQPLLPPIHIPTDSGIVDMESQYTPNSGSQLLVPVLNNHSSIDYNTIQLRITASNSRDFDSSDPFVDKQQQQQHPSSIIGTPSRYGMVTTAIPSTVSDLDMNETTPNNDLNHPMDSPIPKSYTGSDENNHNGNINNALSSGGINGVSDMYPHLEMSDGDYTDVRPPLTMGFGDGNYMNDDNPNTQISDHPHHYNYPYPSTDGNHYVHEQPHLDMYHNLLPNQSDDNNYNNVDDDNDDDEANRNIPLMTGFQLEIQDLE
jgi:hypothetical protein